MTKRVVITGVGGITAFGSEWTEIEHKLKQLDNAVRYMPEWEIYDGLHTKLGAPIDNFVLPDHYTRKKTRSMGRVSLLSTKATEIALEKAGLLDDPELTNGNTGIAFGSSTGSTQPVASFATMMPHTTAVNTGLFFGLKGRLITTSSACTSGSQAIGYAYEAIKYGMQKIMVAGGAEELCPSEAAVFDTLFATSQLNDTPKLSPRPYDRDRDGLVIGEGAGALVLEEYEHAKARGAKIYGEIIGFKTNCDASHITQPRQETIQYCIEQSLKDAGLDANQIGYISAHGTATARGDVAESNAVANIYGNKTPISSLKSYFGHTLGACGAIEAWLTLEMMHSGWFNPTINLNDVDPQCGDLDYIVGEGRNLDIEYFQTNNFAFGGINTSIIIKRI